MTNDPASGNAWRSVGGSPGWVGVGRVIVECEGLGDATLDPGSAVHDVAMITSAAAAMNVRIARASPFGVRARI